MPKTFPINIEVEEIALGSVLRKLNEMPGIVKIDLNLGHGGLGADRKRLEQHAGAKVQNGSREPIALKMLMEGPKHIREISAALGGAKSRAYGLMNSLSKKGLTKSVGKGVHELTKRAAAQLGGAMKAVPALPAPAPQVKHGPAGRASPGSGAIILRSVLHAGPAHPSDLRKQLAEKGMSTKSISGVLDRGKKNGIIKKNGSDLYELTSKGMKIELGAHHDG